MASTIQTIRLHAPDITCSHCERTILKALKPLRGIQEVKVDIPSRDIQVSFDRSQIDTSTIAQVLEEQGYPVQEKNAPMTDQANRPNPERGACCGSCHI